MRVVAGSAGGRRLRAPAGRQARPTSERVREAIFSSLASLGAVDGARVLDLFAGSGALGIEALSRGAAAATFVDHDPAAIAAVQANLSVTGLVGTVRNSDALAFLETAPEFDLALVDPPYAYEQWADILARLRASLVVLESDRQLDVGETWRVLKRKRYGDTVVTLARAADYADYKEGHGWQSP